MTTALAALALAATVSAKDEEVILTDELRALMADLMINTKVSAVTGNEGPAEDYQPDEDPMTLEIVMLPKRSDDPSRVLHGGEVIVLNAKAKDKEQQKLITTAFYLKAQRKLAEPNKPLQPIAPTSGAPAER